MADGVELATGYVSLVISGDQIGPGVKRSLGAAEGEAERAGKRSGKRFGSAFGSGLKLIGGAAIGAGLVKGFNSSVSAASDLNETVNKSSIIFGKNAAAIEKWADGADRDLGLSKRAALEAAAGFGDMFSQIGFGGAEAAKLSKSVVQMSADLGSFNNLGTDEVADRISAAFRGEYDSLQALIPNINAARVESEALAKTGKKTAKELTAAEKASAVLAIVQKDGARAAGDFARTSDGLANSQKIQAAEVENLKAQIGSGLLPIQLKATRFLADEAVPAISDFVSGMQDGTGAGGDFAEILGDIGSGLKDVYEVGKGVVEFFDGLPGPVKKTAVQLGIALLVLSKLRSATGPALTGLNTFATGLRNVETRAAATAKASAGLQSGLRNVAGAGGMLALADASNRTSKGLGALQGAAGGAALGFAIGGPLVAGVGAVAGGLLGFVTSGKKAEKALIDLGPPTLTNTGEFSDYATTLEGVSAALSDATREMAYMRLEESGLLDKTRALGIEDRTVLNGIVGTQRQRDILAAKLRKQGTDTRALAQDLELERRGIQGSRLAQLQKNLAIAKTKEEVDKAQAALDIFKKTNATATIAVDGTTKVKTELTGILGILTDIASFTGNKDTALPGRDESGLFPEFRALGGPVTAGQPYVVGEKRAELFIPKQSGRILPRVPTASSTATAGPISLAGQRVTLTLFGRQVEGIFEAVADSRIDAAQQITGMTERAY